MRNINKTMALAAAFTALTAGGALAVPVNLALGGTATASSTCDDLSHASLAIDGNIFNSFCIFSGDYIATWQLDLGSMQTIAAFNIWSLFPGLFNARILFFDDLGNLPRLLPFPREQFV